MGIEINDYFYNLQKKVIKQQQLGNRVSVVLGDITSTNGRSLLSSGSFDRNISTSSPPDVVMFNNVFQFFVGEDDVDHDAKMTIPKGKGKREPSGREKLQHIWQSIRNSLTNSGTIIVAIPSLEEQFETAEVQQERDRERREKTSNNLSKKKVSVDLESWVKPLNLGKSETQLEEFQTSFGLQDEEVDDIKNVHLYEIL